MDAGADLVDINFGCPVRKVTKTGAGATLLDQPELACRIVSAVAAPCSARHGEDAPRARERRSDVSRSWARGLSSRRKSLTLHPRSARQMYTGEADHSLTAELVELVDVPVIASGDVVSHARAVEILERTGAAAVMVGRAAQGNPWTLSEIIDGSRSADPRRGGGGAHPFVRETVKELGERRAASFLKKFYGWYLRRGGFPRPFVQELVRLESTEEVVERLLIAEPEAAEPHSRDSRPSSRLRGHVVPLPISAYGGG